MQLCDTTTGTVMYARCWCPTRLHAYPFMVIKGHIPLVDLREWCSGQR